MNRYDPIFKLLAKIRKKYTNYSGLFPLTAQAIAKEDIFELFKEFDRIDASLPLLYDPAFGDERVCCCGDPYYRHFDTYDDMEPVGCKYCICGQWHESVAEHDHSYETHIKNSKDF